MTPAGVPVDYRQLFNELATAVILVDDLNRVTWLNAAAEYLLGTSNRRALLKPLGVLVPGIEPLADICERARTEQTSFGQSIRIPAPQRDGTEQEFGVRISPMGDRAADPLLIELFDITTQNQMGKGSTLVAQHGVSRRMIRQLAHEIRNPLGGLRGAAQLLERELGDPALREFTQVIIGEADRLAALMDSLLGPGRQPHTQSTNVHEILERVTTIVESEWATQSILRDYDPSLPDLKVDPDQLTQAFLNLLRNAAQAVDGQGELTVRTRALTNQILNQTRFKLVALVEIEDNGPGVPPDIAETLFYPLVSGREDGTGLGLPLAQDLVSRHNGLIEYESVPGRTVFRVQLPIADRAESRGNG